MHSDALSGVTAMLPRRRQAFQNSKEANTQTSYIDWWLVVENFINSNSKFRHLFQVVRSRLQQVDPGLKVALDVGDQLTPEGRYYKGTVDVVMKITR
jgi:hypothetical protein